MTTAQPIKSQKAIMSAITATYIKSKNDVVKLINEEVKLPNKISNKALFETLMILLNKNKKFAKKFLKLMQESGEFRNADDSDYRNVVPIAAIVGAVGALSSVAGNYIKAKGAKEDAANYAAQREHEMAMAQIQARMKQQELEAQKRKTTTMLIIAGIIVIAGIGGLIIYKNK